MLKFGEIFEKIRMVIIKYTAEDDYDNLRRVHFFLIEVDNIAKKALL